MIIIALNPTPTSTIGEGSGTKAIVTPLILAAEFVRAMSGRLRRTRR
jgi:hypothetical protein